jgi:Nuclease-related domain
VVKHTPTKKPTKTFVQRQLNLVKSTRRYRRWNHARDARTARWSRSEVHRTHTEFFVKTWKATVLVGVITAIICFTIGTWLPVPSFAGGFIAGVIVSAAVALVALIVVTSSGTLNKLVGIEGEERTAHELRRLQRNGWHVINGLTMADKGDCDHVLIGHGRVMAIETKWSSKPWDLRSLSTYTNDNRLTAAAGQIDRGVDRIGKILLLGKIQTEVTGIVVVWGPTVENTHQLQIHGKSPIMIVHGDHLHDFIRTLTPTESTFDEGLAWDLIAKQVEKQDPYDEKKNPPPTQIARHIAVAGFGATLSGAAILAMTTLATKLSTTPALQLVLIVGSCLLVGLAIYVADRRKLNPVATAAAAFGFAAFLVVLAGLIISVNH